MEWQILRRDSGGTTGYAGPWVLLVSSASCWPTTTTLWMWWWHTLSQPASSGGTTLWPTSRWVLPLSQTISNLIIVRHILHQSIKQTWKRPDAELFLIWYSQMGVVSDWCKGSFTMDQALVTAAVTVNCWGDVGVSLHGPICVTSCCDLKPLPRGRVAQLWKGQHAVPAAPFSTTSCTPHRRSLTH